MSRATGAPMKPHPPRNDVENGLESLLFKQPPWLMAPFYLASFVSLCGAASLKSA